MNVAEPFVAGVLLGLANAAHCAGMCGVFALRATAAPGRVAGFGLYGLGKLFSYVVLGAVAGAAGARLLRAASGAQAALGIAAGGVLVLAGVARLRPAGAFRLLPEPVARALAAPFAGLARADLPGGRFTLGAASGLLPCGVVYLAALQGAAYGSPLAATTLMAGFGLGTLPVLGGVGFAGASLKRRLGERALRYVGGGLLILGGALLIARAVAAFAAGEPSCCH